jgi:hypothetical protein
MSVFENCLRLLQLSCLSRRLITRSAYFSNCRSDQNPEPFQSKNVPRLFTRIVITLTEYYEHNLMCYSQSYHYICQSVLRRVKVNDTKRSDRGCQSGTLLAQRTSLCQFFLISELTQSRWNKSSMLSTSWICIETRPASGHVKSHEFLKIFCDSHIFSIMHVLSQDDHFST